MQYDYVPKTLEKYIIKIPTINLSHSKEFETLLTSSKMACSDMITCTAKTVFQQITWNSDKGPRLRMDVLQMYLHNHWLAPRR